MQLAGEPVITSSLIFILGTEIIDTWTSVLCRLKGIIYIHDHGDGYDEVYVGD